MNEVVYKELNRAFELHKEGKLREAEHIYNSILNVEMENPQVLYLLGNVYSQLGYNGLAVNLFTNCLTAKPDFHEAWIDMGVALRKENQDGMALAAWDRAEALCEHHEIHVNKATLYADSGEPEKALELCNKAIEMLGNGTEKTADALASAHWNKALALLSLQRWEEGWKEHNWRRKLKDVWNDRGKIEAPLWDGKPVGRLYLHGEQGKGDEIMFLSILKDVLPLAKEIVVEVNGSVKPLVDQMGYQTVTVVPGQDEATGKFDAKCALADLGQFFRNRPEDFPGTHYLKADPERVEHYRNELNKLGPGPYVGVSWFGGTKATRVHVRTVSIGRWKNLLEDVTAVSLQWGEFGSPDAIKHDVAVIEGASDGKNLAEQAALIEALDYVITVQGTAVHLSGALGKKTYVLTSNSPSWRYGAESCGNKMSWYGSVELIRQGKEEKWDSVLERVNAIIRPEKRQAA